MKNLDLAKCVGRLQDEKDKLREALSWLSSQEPQLGMMIASCKCFDDWALGLYKVGEGSGEREWEIWECFSSTTTHTQR
jgi:hypothetical protein